MKEKLLIYFSTLICVMISSCEVKTSKQTSYKILFPDSNAIDRFINLIGAESINGEQSLYSDSVDHVLLTVNILNPSAIQDLNKLDSINFPLADSLLTCLTYNYKFDSLVVNYTQRSSILFFVSENNNTYFYGKKFIASAQQFLFQDQINMRVILDSLAEVNEWRWVNRYADSLLDNNKYYNLVFPYKIRALLYENTNEYSKPKSMLMKEISKRPYDMTLNLLLGYILYMEKKYVLSSKYLDNVLLQDPNAGLANYYRGFIYVYAKDFKSAMNHFKKVKEAGLDSADEIMKKIQEVGY